MSQSNEREIEAATRFVDEERDRRVANIRRRLTVPGDDDCIDCGDPIDIARRMALPSAMRCIECQERHERINRG